MAENTNNPAGTAQATPAADSQAGNPEGQQQNAAAGTTNPTDQAAAGNAAASAHQGQQDQNGQQQDQQPAELKLPENSLLDDKAVERINALKLPADQAQKALEYANAEVAAYVERQTTTWKQEVSGWAEAVKADQELGGQAFDQNVQFAQAALKKYATPEFIQALNETGYGNHPELVRVFVRIGKAMSEDKPVQGGPASGGQASHAQILYGKND